VLEVGVGTGKNFPYYPSGVRITAIDFSRRMLGRARLKVQNEHLPVELLLMDVERLALQENSFDAVVASFVFCSTPHPVQGLKELLRVCKPGGKILLLEHVRSANPFLGKLMDLLNPVIVRIFGANINRNTVTNVERSGLRLEKVTDLWGGIVKLIEARK
jgi:ubiquinone/menaquinone biosynthesis C-methylase UbiE